MKIKRSLVVGCLTALLGVGAAVGAGSVTEKAPVKEAEAAATFVEGSTFFFRSTMSWWYDASAWTAARFYTDGGGEYWVAMSYNYFSDNFAWCTVPGNYEKVIVVRMDPNKSLDDHWGAKWNQTVNLSAGNGDCFVASSGGGDSVNGSWSTFSSQQTWHIGVGSNMTQLSYRNNNEGAVFYSTNISVTTDKSIYGHRNQGSGNEGWFKSQYFEEGGASAVTKGYIKKNGDDQDATILKDGTLEFYIKMNSQLIWSQVPSSTEAKSYAQEFISTITCSGTGSVTFQINKWNKVGSETISMEYKYENLSTGAKNIMNGTTSSSDADVLAARERYDEVLRKHGYGTAEGQYHDFMNRKPSMIAPNIIIPGIIENNNDRVIIWVVVASAITLAAVGGFFFIKRRKHDR